MEPNTHFRRVLIWMTFYLKIVGGDQGKCPPVPRGPHTQR